MPRNQPWPDDQRRRALDLYRTDGLAAAHRATGIPKPTITGWAHAAGITAERSTDKDKTADATAERRRALDDARDRRAVLLATVTELALQRTVDAVRDLTKPLEVRDLVGVWTRGQHDLALLEGKSTANLAVSVTLNVPPAATVPPVVIPEQALPALQL